MENETLNTLLNCLDEIKKTNPMILITFTAFTFFIIWIFYDIMTAKTIYEEEQPFRPGDKVRYTANEHLQVNYPSCDSVFVKINPNGRAIIEHQNGIRYIELDREKKYIAVRFEDLRHL